MNSKKGLILIAHGSREASTHMEMNALVDQLSSKKENVLVAGAYMEIQSPDLKEVVSNLVEEGITVIDVMPLFIFKGRHMKKDIPAQIEECREFFADCKINLLPHLAISDKFADMIAESV